MDARQNPQAVELLLQAVVKDLGSAKKRQVLVYLHFVQQQGKLRPIKLGTGRSAVVLLATQWPSLQDAGNLYAVKFLRDDPDPQYGEASAQRFFTEAMQVQLWGRASGYLVNYLGWGAIAKNTNLLDTRGNPKEFWWNEHYFKEYDAEVVPSEKHGSLENPILNNNSEVFRRLKEYLKLQGPFYVMELCQGTLEDLLEGSESWSQLPVYQWIEQYRKGLKAAQAKVESDIKDFYKYYLHPAKPKASGYDILNAFHTEEKVPAPTRTGFADPTVIRTYAVLQLFKEIVGTVENLHKGGQNNLDPLAHRDIKPGNIFLQHPFDKPTHLSIRLADLGYVIALKAVDKMRYEYIGDTRPSNRYGTAYQAPGSQFYRAPEQAELPIEVRVDVDRERRNVVRVKGVKLGGIEPNDSLLIDDLQEDSSNDIFIVNAAGQIEVIGQPDGRSVVPHPPEEAQQDQQLEEVQRQNAHYSHIVQPVFTIIKVEQNQSDKDIYELVLDTEVLGDDLYNLHAQITKSTGFHTDGYSLGAILYDLISGGKNPEHFFTYCLRVFTTAFTRGIAGNEQFDSVDAITDVLSPPQVGEHSPDTVWKTSFRPETKSYDFERPMPRATTGPAPDGSLIRLFASGLMRKGADHYMDHAVAQLYPAASSAAGITWGDIWRQARYASGDDADAILEQLTRLLYARQSVQNEAMWQCTWHLVRAARTVDSADEFLDLAIRILYDNGSGLTPEDGSIWQLVKRAQHGINADDFLDGVVESLYMDRPEDRARKIRNLQFRKFHVVKDLLKDKRDMEIPRDIIRLIVRCMMRSIERAFYQLHPEHGFKSAENTLAAAAIRDEVSIMMGRFDVGEGSVPASIRDNILFSLRCLSPEKLRVAQPAIEPPAPTAEPPVIVPVTAEERLPLVLPAIGETSSDPIANGPETPLPPLIKEETPLSPQDAGEMELPPESKEEIQLRPQDTGDTELPPEGEASPTTSRSKGSGLRRPR